MERWPNEKLEREMLADAARMGDCDPAYHIRALLARVRELEAALGDGQSCREQLEKFVSHAMTVKKINTPEWMAYFADCINEAIKAIGSEDSVHWPGKWASEFRFKIGG